MAVAQAKKRPAISMSEWEAADAVLQLRSGGKSAEEVAASNEIALVLQGLIAALPDSLRDVMRLTTVEELSTGEVAEVLETSEASVRARLFRARQILRDKLQALEVSYGK